MPQDDPCVKIPQLLRLKGVVLAGANGRREYLRTQYALDLARQSSEVQVYYASGGTEEDYTFQIDSTFFLCALQMLKTAKANPGIVTEEWVLSPPLAEKTLHFLDTYAVRESVIDRVLSNIIARKLESSLGVDDIVLRVALLSCSFPVALGMTRTNATEILRSRLDTTIPRFSKRLLLTPDQVQLLAPQFQEGHLPLPLGFAPCDAHLEMFPRDYCTKMSMEYMTEGLKCFRLVSGLKGFDTGRAVFQRSVATATQGNVFVCTIPWIWDETPYELRVSRGREGWWQLVALEDTRRQRVMHPGDQEVMRNWIESVEVSPLKKITLFTAPGSSFLPHPPSDYWVAGDAPDKALDPAHPLRFGDYNSGLHVCTASWYMDNVM